MKNYLFIGVAVLVIIGLVIIFGNKKGGSNLSGVTNMVTGEVKKSEDIFKNMTDMCSTLTKEQVSKLTGKPIVKTVPLTSGTLHSCQYYMNDSQAIVVNNDFLNVADQKKGQEFLGRKITTNPKIPMENFLVIQEDGLINEIYLVLGPNNYVSVNRTSSKTLTEDEVTSFAEKLAEILTGKIPLTKSVSTNTVTPTEKKEIVPLPQETDTIKTFFSLIEEKRVSEAVGMMVSSATGNDNQKQTWGVQLNAMNSVKVLSVDPSMPEEWSSTSHTYKVTLDVSMNPDSANAPIPYYGWTNGQNIRWMTVVRENNLWKIEGIATGP